MQGGDDKTMIHTSVRGYFNSARFNTVVGEYFKNFLDEFLKQYILVSAKGSSGQQFQTGTGGSRIDKVINQYDMPYHIHIINGLLPALKLLEERFKKEGWLEQKEAPLFLRCFIVGFTFHDVNKLTGIDELNESVEQFLVSLCENLKLERFFPEWKDWIEEIKFLALGTEYRTKIYAHQKTIKEHDFFNSVLAEHCHLADSIASMEGFSSVANFYEQLCNKQMNGRRLADLWQLSFVEVQENIFTLLSQKLLFAAKTLIQDKREQTVLFTLRNGFVYIGQPLDTNEIGEIKMDFKSDLSDVVKSSLLDFQTCKYGFLENLSEENDSENKYHGQIKNALEKILKAGFANSGAGSEKIKPFAITNYATLLKEKSSKPQAEEEIKNLGKMLDENELPLTVFSQKAVQNYFLRLSKKWDDVSESDKKFLTLYALEKIKILSSKTFTKWKPKNSYPNYSTATERTVIALMNAINLCKAAETGGKTIVDALESVWSEVLNTLSTSSLVKTLDTQGLDDFVNFYLSGNFKRDINKVVGFIGEIPKKADMCLFTGRKAMTKYGAERVFGISALNFSNRSLNTLKSKDNQISSLFFQENELRLKELPRGFYTKKLKEEDKNNFDRQMFLDASGANAVIYYDFGEYFVDVSSRQLLDVLSKAFSYDCRDVNGLTLIFNSLAYDFNLYGMNFNRISEDVESNFYFIHQMLKLIQKTGFRIFVSGILTPYHSHKYMFVFENCMPFVKRLGWDRIRIDQIESRLQEMNLLLSLNAKRLVSNVLNYAEDRQSIFTAFALLDDDNKTKARNVMVKFIYSQKEVLKMSVMNELAQIAIEMVRPKSGSTSQESWIMRDALKVLKDCHKEGRDKETAIEQIAGDLRKTLKSRDYADLSKCELFAKALYEKLFEQEWKKHFPQPGRLRNWVNQFAFLYSDKGYIESRKSKIKGIIKKLRDEGKDVSEDSVIQSLVAENKKLEKYVDDYREVYQEVVLEFK
jgi:CRISPR-associated protein Csc3